MGNIKMADLAADSAQQNRRTLRDLEERVSRLESAVFPVDHFIKKAVRDFDSRGLTFADLEVGEWFRDECGDLCQKAKPESGNPEDNCIVFRSDEESGFCYDHEPSAVVTRVPNPLKGLL